MKDMYVYIANTNSLQKHKMINVSENIFLLKKALVV